MCGRRRPGCCTRCGWSVTRRSADRVADLFPVVAASGADSWGLHLWPRVCAFVLENFAGG